LLSSIKTKSSFVSSSPLLSFSPYNFPSEPN